MVNSGSFDAAGSEGESVKAEFTQLEDDAAEASFTAVVPEDVATPKPKTNPSLQCSVPLDKVKNVLKSKLILDNYIKQKTELGDMPDASKKRLMCLFCDRTFTSNNLKQKHVDRCHSAGQTRRSSSRTPNHSQSATACCFCSKLNHTDHTLKQLLEHLTNEHSNRYYACLPCQERFNSIQTLREHNRSVHGLQNSPETKTPSPSPVTTSETNSSELSDGIRPELKRTSSNESTSSLPATAKDNSSPSLKKNSSVRKLTPETNKQENNVGKGTGFPRDFEDSIQTNVISQEDAKKLKQHDDDEEDLVLARRVKNGIVNSKTRNAHKKNQVGNKKISVKSTKNGLRNLRTTRASVKQMSNNFTKNRKKIVKHESEPGKEVTKRHVPNPASVFSLVNAYIYKYEKIYDHASDSIKDANSVQFNAVFDKEFYARTVCNIRDNLLHHLDGKLNRNVESENRISNFEHPTCISETDAKPANDAVDNFGCDLSLNAVTPVATLLGSSQYGEDFDAQIEYGAKASQKKPKKVTVVKYKFPSKKFNSVVQEKDSQSDLTCLDMWTQLSVKKRQHRLNGDNFTEDLRNFQRPTGEWKVQVEELNKILDTRGPFEDLRVEANAQQFLELRKKSAKEGDYISEESSKDVYFVLEDLLSRVMCKISENTVPNETDVEEIKDEESKLDVPQNLELPGYLQLQRNPSKSNDFKMDKTDSIAIICASQDESEMKENKRMELTGEWTRPRIYICATCGIKLPNLKSLDDHKNVTHPHIWCSHYEFVGSQSQIYRHLSIPGLGKVGIVEKLPLNRQWQRSDARMCSKCTKQCHNLGELHKHILECGGDWTWMLARKKCKYRPYGARTRRRRQRGYKRSCNPEVNRAREHKPKIKPLFIGPRPKPSKPSDAETIERMLANLPPKRHRKMISMRDGIQRPRKAYKQTLKPSSSNTKTNSTPKLTNKKVHFKNNSPQISKQTIRNALKRKISANNLRKQNKNDSETDSSDTPLTLRSKIKKDDDESDIIKQKILGRNNIRNKRMISRILGSKIFDTNSALLTRRKLAKVIAQTNLIRKTRLRSKMQLQQSSNKLKEDEINEEHEEKLPSKNRSLEIASQDSDKKTKILKSNSDETDSKVTKKEESNSKSVESDAKPKKSNTKRFLSVLTKSNKKTKVPEVDKDKPDTISAIIDDVISRGMTTEVFELKFNTKRKRSRKSRNSLVKINPSKSKNKEEGPEKKTNNNSDEVKNVKESDGKTEKIITKKKNKLVQNVKSFRKSFRNKEKSGEKSEGIASKLIRTLSMRGSKKKKIAAKNETKTKSVTSETIDQNTELKKTTTEDQSKEPENKNNIPELESIDKQCDIQNSSKTSADSDMPTLEKIEPLPSHVSLSNSANSIPILCPININPCESDASVEKETKSDSDVCSDNKTDVKSCDKSSANNCSSLNKFKNKIKRSGRGLNDCIAMLKCKLEQKQQSNTEPSLIDKSNLFILNSTDVNKHSQPVVQEKIDDVQVKIDIQGKINVQDKIDVQEKNDLEVKVDLEEKVDVEEKVDGSCSDTNESRKINTITRPEKNEQGESKNLDDSKLSESTNAIELKNEPKKPERNVLEIPSFKINISTPEISTVETQTQTVEEDIVPNAAIDYMPTNIETNFQLSYVLNATLQNCLMECVKNKCEELKIENENLKSNKSGTKIGSVRKRIHKTNTIGKEKRVVITRKPKTNTLDKSIPNIPTLLNTAFTEKCTPKKVTKKPNSKSKLNSKAASDTSDDDIPLSKFVSNPSSTKLKINLPVAKKKRSSKKHIAFTPLILNNQDSHIPQVSLQERLEQRISLDNSMNDKIEAIQKEVATIKEIDNEIQADININNDKDVTNETDVKIDTPRNIPDVINTEETTPLNKESETVIGNTADINVELPVEIKEILSECKNVNNEEPISNINIEDSTSNVNIEKQDVSCNQEDIVHSTEITSETPKEILQENTVNVNATSKDENEIENIKESVATKDILESLQPLSQQIMAMEDEPCDSFLINKTLTEANTKPASPTKNLSQNNSHSESVDDQSNHFDSGKENTECQDMLKPKRITRRIKKKRGKSKVGLSDEIIDSSISTDMDQSLEKLVENYDTSVENIPQLVMEDTSTPKRKRGRAKKIQAEISESDISTTDLDTTAEKTQDISAILAEDAPQNATDGGKIKTRRGRRKTIHKESENSESDNRSTKDLDKPEETSQDIVVSAEVSPNEDPLPKVNTDLIKPIKKRGRKKKIQPEMNESTDSAMPTDSEAETTLNKEKNKNNPEQIKPKGRRGRRKRSEIIALAKLIDSELETTDTPNESNSQNEDKQISSEKEEKNIENVHLKINESIDLSKPADSNVESENKETLNEIIPPNENIETTLDCEAPKLQNTETKIIEPVELSNPTYPETESAEVQDTSEDSSPKLNEEENKIDNVCSDNKINEENLPKMDEDIIKPKKRRGRKKKVELQQPEIMEKIESVPTKELQLTETLENTACDISTNDIPTEENISKVDEQLDTLTNCEIENIPSDQSNMLPTELSEKIDTGNIITEESHKILEVPTETNTIVIDNKNEQSVINESITDIITDLNEIITENEHTKCELPTENIVENVQKLEETSVIIKKKRGRKKKVQPETQIMTDVSISENVSNMLNEEIVPTNVTKRIGEKRGRKKKVQPVILEAVTDISTNLNTTVNKSDTDVYDINNEEMCNTDILERRFEKRVRPKRIQSVTDVSFTTDVNKIENACKNHISNTVPEELRNRATSEIKVGKRGRKKKVQAENIENLTETLTTMIENVNNTVAEEICHESTPKTTGENLEINESVPDMSIITLDKTLSSDENNVDSTLTDKIYNSSTSEERFKKRGRQKKIQAETIETIYHIPTILGLIQTENANVVDNNIINQKTFDKPVEKRGRKKKIQSSINEDVSDKSPTDLEILENNLTITATEEMYNENILDDKCETTENMLQNNEAIADILTVNNLDKSVGQSETDVNNVVTEQIYNEETSKRKSDKRGRKKKIQSESVEFVTDVSAITNLDTTENESENDLTKQIINESTSEIIDNEHDRIKKHQLENMEALTDVSTITKLDTSLDKSESDVTEKIYNKSVSEKPIEKRGRKKKVQLESIAAVTDVSTTKLNESMDKSESDVSNIIPEEIHSENISERKVEKRGRKKKVLLENNEGITATSVIINFDTSVYQNKTDLSNIQTEETYIENVSERPIEKRGRKKKIQLENTEAINDTSVITNVDTSADINETDLNNVQPEETYIESASENPTEKRGRKKKVQLQNIEATTDIPVITNLDTSLYQNEANLINIQTEETYIESVSKRPIEKHGRKKEIQIENSEAITDTPVIINLDTSVYQNEIDLSNIQIEHTYIENLSESPIEKRGRKKKVQLEDINTATDTPVVTILDTSVCQNESSLINIQPEETYINSVLERPFENGGRKKKVQLQNIEVTTNTPVITNYNTSMYQNKTNLGNIQPEETYVENVSERRVEKGGRKKKVQLENIETAIDTPVVKILDTSVYQNENDLINIQSEETYIESVLERPDEKGGRKKKVQLQNIEVAIDTPVITNYDTSMYHLSNTQPEETYVESVSEKSTEKRVKKIKIQLENIEAEIDTPVITNFDTSMYQNKTHLSNTQPEETYVESESEKSTEKRARKKKNQLENIEAEIDTSVITNIDTSLYQNKTDLINVQPDESLIESVSKKPIEKRGRKKKVQLQNNETVTDTSVITNFDISVCQNETDLSNIQTEETYVESVSERPVEKRGRKKKVQRENSEAIIDTPVIPNFDTSVYENETDLINTQPEVTLIENASERLIEKRGRKKKVQLENIEAPTDVLTLDTSTSISEIDIKNTLTEKIYNAIPERTIEKRGRKKKAQHENVQAELDTSLSKSETNLNKLVDEERYNINTSERTSEKRGRKKKVQPETLVSETDVYSVTYLDRTFSKSENDLSNMLDEDIEDVAEITGETTIKIMRNRGRRKTINVELNTATEPIINTCINPNSNELEQSIHNINIAPLNEDALQKTDETIKIKKKRGRKKSVYIQEVNTELNNDASVTELNPEIQKSDDCNVNNEIPINESINDETTIIIRKRGRRKSTYIPSENNALIDGAPSSVENTFQNDLPTPTDDTLVTDKLKRKRGRRKTVHLDEELNEIIDDNLSVGKNLATEESAEVYNISQSNIFDAVDGTVTEESRPKRKRSRSIVYTEPDIEDPVPEIDTDKPTENSEINKSETPVEKRKRSRARIYIEPQIEDPAPIISTENTDQRAENTEVNKSELVVEKRKRIRAKIYIEAEIKDPVPEISTVDTNQTENTEVGISETVTEKRKRSRSKVYSEPDIEDPLPEIVDANPPTEISTSEPVIEKKKRSRSKVYIEPEIECPVPELCTVEDSIPKISSQDINHPTENTELNKSESSLEIRKQNTAKIDIESNIEDPLPEISAVDIDQPSENTEVDKSEISVEKRKRSRARIYIEPQIEDPIPEITPVEIDQPVVNNEVTNSEAIVEKRKRSRAKIYIEDPDPVIPAADIAPPSENSELTKSETIIEKGKRIRAKIYIEPAVDEPIPEISAVSIDQSAENIEVNVSEKPVENDMPISEDFRTQIQSSIENEPETLVMENKDIQEPTVAPIKDTPAPTEQNSDSEDELPLAILLKNKKDNSLLENMEMSELETDKFEVDISIPSQSKLINNSATEDETLNNSMENILNVTDKNSSENQDFVDLEDLSSKIENAVDDNIDNNKEDVYEFTEEDMNNSTEDISNLIEHCENMSNQETSTEIQDTVNNQTELLETHFDLDNNVTTESRNIKLDLNLQKEIYNQNSYITEDPNMLNTPTAKQMSENQSSFITTPDLVDKSLVIKIKTNFNIKIKKPKKTRRRVIPKSLARCNIKRKEKDDEEVRLVAICEICNKTFKRKENLASHKRTLTHIAKLSEIEAKETLARKSNEEPDENKDDEVNEEANLEDVLDHNNDENIELGPDINEIIENLEPITNTINLKENVENIISDIENKELILDDAEIEELVKEDSNINEILDIQEQSSDNVILLDDKEVIDDELSTDTREISKENFINIDRSNIVQPVEEILDIKSQTQAANLIPDLNTNLKLVDIISEVLDKPVNELICDANYLPQNIRRSTNNCDSNDKYSEPKRYKSLGERKSFDSENYNSTSKCNDEITKETYNTSLGSINNGLLSKQLSLLENIIEETNPNLNYIDDSISLSSNHFDEPVLVEHNISEKDLFKPGYHKLNNPEIKFSHTADVLSSLMKPNNRFNHFQNISDSFAKPSKHIEGITNQMEHEVQKKSVKDNSKRKILNRDEELFLECCSLLKSGSEISSVSKKSTKNIPLNSFSRSNDASWIIQKQPNSDQFIQRDSYSWLAQSSRVDTPIGEPFVNNDWSNSNSAVSSEWLAQKAPSPDRPIESNTLMKKSNNNSGETKYSDIQFEDISIDTSLETSKTLMAIDNSNTENIPLDFHHVDFANKNFIEKPEIRENSKSNDLEIDPFIDINDNSENTTSSSRENSSIRIKSNIFLKPEQKSEENVPNNDEFDPELKKKVVSAFGGLMAKALSNRLHAVVRKPKKAKGKRDFDSAIQASITDYAVPVKKNKLNTIDSDSNDCPKKLITKGAMKVFEGLKVSIPTQDLNLKEVLNCSNKPKNGETEPENIPIIPKEMKETILEKSEKVIESTKNGKLKNLFCRFGNKLGLKETKKKASKHRNKSKSQTEMKKPQPHDVYDFEESSLDSNMFKAGKFSLFRKRDQNSETADAETSKKTEDYKMEDTKHNHESGIGSLKWNENESDSDTDRYYDSMSFEEMSLSSESTHGSDLNINKVKPVQKKTVDKSKENQKKCMIMGRIFKNASKPKLEDKIPEIRDISSEENSKLVETFLDSYSSVDNVENTVQELPTVPNNVTVVNNSANKMSKIEMDLLFDKLLQEEKKLEEMPTTIPIENEQITEEQIENNAETIHIDKNSVEKKKIKEGKPKISGKIKKRQRYNSGDSTSSDEFTLGNRHSKSSKKHHKTPRKSNKPRKDTGINLEQEIKECIGVAGRKSQRKCTSGKQNVLIEFWSSDESSFEEVIKMLGKENEPAASFENKSEETEHPFIEPEEPLLNNSNSNSKEDLHVAEIIESAPKNSIDIYDFESDIEPKQDALKIKIKLTDPNLKSETNFVASSKIKIPRKTKRIGKSRKHSKSHGEESDDTEFEIDKNRKREHKRKKSMENVDASMLDQSPDCLAVSRKKRNAGDQLYYWSSSSDDEFQDLIEVKPIREDQDDDRPMQHGWIVGDSPKKLVTMLAQAKGKKVEGESVKEQGKKNRVTL